MNKSSFIVLSCLVLVGGGLMVGTFQPRDNHASPIRVTVRTAEERAQLAVNTRQAIKATLRSDDEYAYAATPTPIIPKAADSAIAVETPVVNEPTPNLQMTPAQIRAQSLDLNPLQVEPREALLTGGISNGDCALELVNTLPSPAYVKVLNQAGSVVATVYLHSDEKLQIALTADNYTVRYASGPAAEWRGTTVYFGSHTTFFQNGKYEPITTNQILTLTLFQHTATSAADGLTPISDEEFAR